MDAARPASSPVITGIADGPDVVLQSGVRVGLRRLGGRRVSQQQLQQALAGIAALPLAHQQLVARAGVRIELVPSASLDGANMLGATSIETDASGRWRPSLVRVAVASPLSAAGTGRHAVDNITQHEIGHVLAVLTAQDRSEAAAERYAERY